MEQLDLLFEAEQHTDATRSGRSIRSELEQLGSPRAQVMTESGAAGHCVLKYLDLHCSIQL